MIDNILKCHMKVSKDQIIKIKYQYIEKKQKINLDDLGSGKHFLEYTNHKSDIVFNNCENILLNSVWITYNYNRIANKILFIEICESVFDSGYLFNITF